jgi:hypothetical protein
MLTQVDRAYWRAECAKRCMLGSGEGRGKRAESSVPRLLPILLLTELSRPGRNEVLLRGKTSGKERFAEEAKHHNSDAKEVLLQ